MRLYPDQLHGAADELEALLQQKDSETPPLSNDQTTYPNEYSMAGACLPCS